MLLGSMGFIWKDRMGSPCSNWVFGDGNLSDLKSWHQINQDLYLTRRWIAHSEKDRHLGPLIGPWGHPLAPPANRSSLADARTWSSATRVNPRFNQSQRKGGFPRPECPFNKIPRPSFFYTWSVDIGNYRHERLLVFPLFSAYVAPESQSQISGFDGSL